MLVWHRRAGKDLFGVALAAKEAFLRVGTYWHLFPERNQGRNIIWEGTRGDGSPFLDIFPPESIASSNATDMRLRLVNGSRYQVVGADNFDKRLIGNNPVGIILSEWAVINPTLWAFLRPILTENKGWALFVTTPRGKNHAFKTFQTFRDHDDCYAEILTVDDTKAMSQADLDEALVEMLAMGFDESFFRQEYYCSWEAPVSGAIYAKEIVQAENEGRVTKVPYDPTFPVDTSWDIGVGDKTAIWCYQQVFREVRMINYIESFGEGLEYYIGKLNATNYNFRHHWAPWDIDHREWTAGMTRKKTAAKMGINFRALKKFEVEDQIQAARALFPRCYFDDRNCELGISALKAYQLEPVPEHSGASSGALSEFKRKPVHNWASHGASAFNGAALAIRPQSTQREEKKKKQEYADHEFDPFTA